MEICSLPTDDLVARLVGLHRADFSRAEKYARRSFYANIATASFAALGAIVNAPLLPYLFSVGALVSAGFGFLWKAKEVRVRQTAEKCRRALVLVHGLGWKVSRKELTDLLSKCESSEEEGRKFEKANYYPPPPTATGPLALAYTLQESAFWSKFLLEKCAWQSGILTISIVAVLVALLLAVPAVARGSWLLRILQLVNVALMFLVTSNLIDDTIRYARSARAVADIDERLDRIVGADAPIEDVILAFTDYNSAVESAPKIPNGLYNKYEEYLNGLWNERVAKTYNRSG